MGGCKNVSFKNGKPAALSVALAKMNYKEDPAWYHPILLDNIITGADLSYEYTLMKVKSRLPQFIRGKSYQGNRRGMSELDSGMIFS